MSEPIQFHHGEDGKVFVDCHWPRTALIAMDLVNNSALSDGRWPSLISRDREGQLIIRVENGHAVYRIRNIMSDGNYFCEYVSGDYHKQAA